MAAPITDLPVSVVSVVRPEGVSAPQIHETVKGLISVDQNLRTGGITFVHSHGPKDTFSAPYVRMML